MIIWSVVVGAFGLCGTGAWLARQRSRSPQASPERYWLLGMAALFPAWLIAFLSVLSLGIKVVPKGVVIGTSVAPLLGAIVTDAIIRRMRESGDERRPMTYWLLGVAALLPGWGVGLLALVLYVVAH
ncbi:MAG: hypothetical protein ACE5MG_05075 [Candidatus Methylomirabilales bacterium]